VTADTGSAKDTEKVSGDYGGGNGGDGAIIAADPVEEVNNISKRMTTRDWEAHFRHVFDKTKPLQLFSLDLAEFGLERNAYIDFDPELDAYSDIACMKSIGCYAIRNPILFDELMDYGGFFGKELEFNGEFEAWQIYSHNDELADLYHAYSESSSKHSDVLMDHVINYFGSGERELPENNDLSRLKTELDSNKKRYRDAVKEHFQGKRVRILDETGILAIGIINKLEQIKSQNSRLADQLASTLIDLEWMIVNRPLEEINDEGKLGTKHEGIVQMANRDQGIVRITSLGWNEGFEYGEDETFVKPMNVSNKLGVIFHEVNYEITHNNGEWNSESARMASAMMFRNTRINRSIKKAAEILQKK
jgi:hypothetical protein